MERVALIGFGEAARAFAGAPGWQGRGRAFDLKSLDPATRAELERSCESAGVELADDAAGAVAAAAIVLSLVTADQALAAARSVAGTIAPDAIFLDANSVAPDTKRAAAGVIAGAGARYVDVAVMAPVLPLRLAAPLLVSGPDAEAGVAALRALGFNTVRAVGGEVGAASAIKMIRSVMVKGMEALTAECVLAADAAGVLDEVIASLDASWPGADWRARADYNLDRMIIHGERRAAEMGEVVRTLDALGTGSAMSRATVERQRAIGRLRVARPRGLDAKLRALAPSGADARRRDAA